MGWMNRQWDGLKAGWMAGNGWWSVALSQVGGQWLLVCSIIQYRAQSCLTSSLMIQITGHGVHSASLLMIQSWEEWITHQRVVLSSRGISEGWRNGLVGTSWRSTKGNANWRGIIFLNRLGKVVRSKQEVLKEGLWYGFLKKNREKMWLKLWTI